MLQVTYILKRITEQLNISATKMTTMSTNTMVPVEIDIQYINQNILLYGISKSKNLEIALHCKTPFYIKLFLKDQLHENNI